jgi:HopJ type III effector protein
MNLDFFLNKLKHWPDDTTFQETMSVIEDNYTFTPTAFQNGFQYNEAGENSGSCKLFAFALLHELTVDQTLACFGAYYFEEVLRDYEGKNHPNIRNFMDTGWDGINFKGEALVKKL